MISHLVDLERLPADYPTHRHQPEFWEKLERTVATFGFLEETLGKAIYAFTVRTRAESDSEEEYEAWLQNPEGLERALTDPLAGLINQLARVVQEQSHVTISELEDLLDQLRAASRLRNVLCHGSWGFPDETGASKPLFIERKRDKREMFDTAIDGTYLDHVRQHVVELAFAVVNLVTGMGWQFPGFLGPGRPVLDRQVQDRAAQGRTTRPA